MTRPIRVLIVEDEAQVVDVIRLWLSASESIAIVGEAKTGDEAIEMAAQVSPDVILLDLRMPGQSGLRALARIRESSREMKVVVYTGVPGLKAEWLDIDVLVEKNRVPISELSGIITGLFPRRNPLDREDVNDPS